jgi:transposase-like protein
MPKKIVPEVRARAVRLVNDHLSEYPSLMAAAEAVAKQVGVAKDSVRRWGTQAQVDAGDREGQRVRRCRRSSVAPIGVEDHRRRGSAPVHRVGDQVGAQVVGDHPADHPARGEVEHGGQVEPAFPVLM